MKRIVVYIRSYGVSPSGYYRVIQYTNKLKGKFIVRNILPPFYYSWFLKNKKNDVLYIVSVLTYLMMYVRILFFLVCDLLKKPHSIVISRGLMPRFFLFPLPMLLNYIFGAGTKLFWDFDDDILLSGEISKKEFAYLTHNASEIIVTHKYLAGKIEKTYLYKTHILPTTDGDFLDQNIISFQDIRKKKFQDKELNLVWVGSAVNLTYVEEVLTILDEISKIMKQKFDFQIVLNICSSKILCYDVKYIVLNNIKWSKEKAIELMLKSHIGIMPLSQSEYALGKGGFKLIQYMAARLPVIGSDIGYNNEIIKETFGFLIKDNKNINEWLNALMSIGVDFEKYKYMSNEAFNVWNTSFSYDKNLDEWSKLLNLKRSYENSSNNNIV